MQNYQVYYTDMPLPPGVSRPNFAAMIPLEFGDKDEAMKEAFKRIFHGAIVWKIDGPGGFHLERAEVEKAYWIFRVT